MSKIKELWNKIKPFTFLNSLGMGILKLVVAAFSHSLGLVISSMYNFLMSFTKKNVYSKKEISIYKKFARVGVLLLISSVLFINYSFAILKLHLNSNYHMYIALIIATVTFTDLTIATVGIIKAKKKNDVQTEMMKYINLATALISLALTQKAILSFTNVGVDMSKWNGIVGMIFGGLACLIGMYMIINGIVKYADEKKQNV